MGLSLCHCHHHYNIYFYFFVGKVNVFFMFVFYGCSIFYYFLSIFFFLPIFCLFEFHTFIGYVLCLWLVRFFIPHFITSIFSFVLFFIIGKVMSCHKSCQLFPSMMYVNVFFDIFEIIRTYSPLTENRLI